MAWKPDYCTLAEARAQLRVTDALDTGDDAAISAAITAASRAIDYECNRQFGSVSPAVARYYSGDSQLMLECGPALAIDDLMTTTSLVIATDLANDGLYSTTMTLGTDVELWPYNAAADARPWTHLVLTPRATTYFPWTRRGIKVTAQYGWSSVPAVVKSACLIQTARFFLRRDSAYGMAGSPDLATEARLLARLDPDVAVLLDGVKRRWGAV